MSDIQGLLCLAWLDFGARRRFYRANVLKPEIRLCSQARRNRVTFWTFISAVNEDLSLTRNKMIHLNANNFNDRTHKEKKKQGIFTYAYGRH